MISGSLSGMRHTSDYPPRGIMFGNPLLKPTVFLAISEKHNDEALVLSIYLAEVVTSAEFAVGYVQELRTPH